MRSGRGGSSALSGWVAGLAAGLVLFLSCPGSAQTTQPERLPAPLDCKPPLALLQARATHLANDPPPADSRGLDVLSYDLDLQLDPSQRLITGRVDLRLAAVPLRGETHLDVVRLDLVPEMVVTAVTDQMGSLAHSHVGSELLITLRSPLPAGAVTDLRINWQGRPPRHGAFGAGLMFRTHDPGTPSDPTDDVPIVASLSQPWSAHSWWPCKDHPADKALVSVAATVPDSLTVVSNGTLLAVTAGPPGWRRFAWREAFPLPTYLVSVAASNYSSWQEVCVPNVGSPVRLDYHFFPEDRAKAERDLAATCDMMEFMVGLAGAWPYPGEKYAQVEFKWIGGMEHTTATSLSQVLITGEGRFESLFLHELAHQWFGDSLTPAAWADIWLNEGLARYCEALWVEHRQGAAAYAGFMATIGPLRHPTLFRGDGTLADPVPILPNSLVYDKGAWVLHMLRQLIGDTAFFGFLHDYAGNPRLQHALVSTADLVLAAETAAGRSLSGFFGPWLQTDQVPVLSHRVRPVRRGSFSLTLFQHQTPLFEVPVPIRLHTACGDRMVVAPLTTAQQTFTWPVDCAVDSVTVAPAGLALATSLGSQSLPMVVTDPSPHPAGADGTSFQITLNISSHVSVNVYDTMGAKIQTEEIGWLTEADPGHVWVWRPGDAGGQRLASGLYYLEFLGGGGRQVKPVVLVR